jgi:putative colanic acid biosynthesis acetyltransferase WcaF
MQNRRLQDYNSGNFETGRGPITRVVWYFTSLLIFESGWVPVSGLKCTLLRFFGAKIGRGVVIKPNVRIKFPWKLSIGNHSWIGQEVWIDNLDEVDIGDNCCISQGAYFCTGSHDHRSETFDLLTGPITVHSNAWVTARCILLAGSIVEEGETLSAGTCRKKSPLIRLTRYERQSSSSDADR